MPDVMRDSATPMPSTNYHIICCDWIESQVAVNDKSIRKLDRKLKGDPIDFGEDEPFEPSRKVSSSAKPSPVITRDRLGADAGAGAALHTGQPHAHGSSSARNE